MTDAFVDLIVLNLRFVHAIPATGVELEVDFVGSVNFTGLELVNTSSTAQE